MTAVNLGDDPAWLSALVEALAAKRTAPLVLPLPLLLTDLSAWLRHSRDDPFNRARTQLAQEVAATRAAVSPGLQAALGGELRQFYGALGRLLNTKLPPHEVRLELATAADGLLRRCGTAEVLTAAWGGLVDDIGTDGFLSPPMVADRVEELASLLDVSDLEAEGTVRRLRGILLDYGYEVHGARWFIGERVPDDAGSPPFHQPAGLTVPERLALCGQVLLRDPPAQQCTVWSAFSMADMNEGMVWSAGPLTFFNAWWAMPNATREDGFDFEHRAELAEVNFRLPEYEAPHLQLWLVRLDMGHRKPRGALEQGAAEIRNFVDIAAVRGGGPRWRPYGWNALVIDGTERANRYGNPDTSATKGLGDAYRLDFTARELTNRGPALAAAVMGNGLPATLSEALASLLEADTAQARSAVVLYERTVELIGAYGGYGDTSDLEEQLLNGWPDDQVRQEIFAAATGALHSEKIYRDRDAYIELTNHIMPSIRGSHTGFNMYFDRIPSRREQLLAAAASPADRAWLAGRLDLLTHATAYLQRRRAYAEQLELLRERHRRTRNAVVHGNPVHERILASARPLGHYLAHLAFSAAVDSFAAGTELRDCLAEHDRRLQALQEHLARRKAPVDFWSSTGK